MAVIRVSGPPGSGKSTFCVRAAQQLGYQYVCTGDIFRAMASELNVSIDVFYQRMQANPALEKEIDSRQALLMNSQNNLIVDGRMAPFQPCRFLTINVLIKVGKRLGAQRQKHRPEYVGLSIPRIMFLSDQRRRHEMDRYRELYGINNYLDESYLQIIVNSTKLTIEEVYQTIMVQLESLLQQTA